MREISTSSSMRGRRKRATAQRACALLYRSPWLVGSEGVIVVDAASVHYHNIEHSRPSRRPADDTLVSPVIILGNQVPILVVDIKVQIGVPVARYFHHGSFAGAE